MNILICNDFFKVEKGTSKSAIYLIGVRGFTVLSFLISLASYQTVVTTASQIMTCLGISKTKEISQILCKLNDLKVFETRDKLNTIKKNDIIELDFTKYLNESAIKNGFTLLPFYIFEKYFKAIGFNGWAVYCLLYRLHNPSFKHGGYANPSENYMGRVLGLHRQTVHKATSILAEQGLIKIVYPSTSNHDIKNKGIPYQTKRYIVIDKKYKIKNMRRKNK